MGISVTSTAGQCPHVFFGYTECLDKRSSQIHTVNSRALNLLVEL